MLLLLLAAAAPGKERAALQADLDSLATTLDSMLGHFEKTGFPTDEEIAALKTRATSDPPRYLYHAAKAEYFKSFHDSGFSMAAKQAGATATNSGNRDQTVLDRTKAHFFFDTPSQCLDTLRDWLQGSPSLMILRIDTTATFAGEGGRDIAYKDATMTLGDGEYTAWHNYGNGNHEWAFIGNIAMDAIEVETPDESGGKQYERGAIIPGVRRAEPSSHSIALTISSRADQRTRWGLPKGRGHALRRDDDDSLEWICPGYLDADHGHQSQTGHEPRGSTGSRARQEHHRLSGRRRGVVDGVGNVGF